MNALDNSPRHRKPFKYIKNAFVKFETYCKTQDDKTRIVESLDFEEIDGPILQESYKEKKPYGIRVQQLARLVLAITLGCLVGAIVSGVSVSTEHLIEARNKLVEENVDHGQYGEAWGIMFGMASGITIIPMFLCLLFPASTGSGMPEVISFLNGTSPKRYHTWVTLVVKLIGMIAVVGAGLYSGYDGPVVHVGCLVALTAIKLLKRSCWFCIVYFREGSALRRGDGSYVSRVQHYREQLFFGAVGTAAAVSAAFRSPIGATVFALEEAVTFFEGQLLLQALVASIAAYLVNGLIKASNVSNGAAYSVFESDVLCTSSSPFVEIFNFILLGCIFGVVGSLYNIIIELVRRHRARLFRGRPFRALFYLIVVIVLTISLVLYAGKRNASAFGDCTPVSQIFSYQTNYPCYLGCEYDNSSNIVYSFTYGDQCIDSCVNRNSDQYADNLLDYAGAFCATLPNTTTYPYYTNQSFEVIDAWAQGAFTSKDLKNIIVEKTSDNGYTMYECYYALSSLLMMTPEHMVKTLLTRGVYNLFSANVLLVFFTIYFFVSTLTVGLAMPTDLVLPTLIIGSTLGRLYGLMTNYFKMRLGLALVDPGDYALLGFAGMWSGSARLPVTITLIALETTFNNDLLPAVVLVTLFATIIGNLLTPSLYEHEIESKGLPYLPADPSSKMRRLQIKDIMIPVEKLKVIGTKERYKTLLSKIRVAEVNGIPVVDKDELKPSAEFNNLMSRGHLLGLVLRSQIKQKLFGTYKMRSKTQKTIHKAGSAIASVAERIRTPSTGRHKAPNESPTLRAHGRMSMSPSPMSDSSTAANSKPAFTQRLFRKLRHQSSGSQVFGSLKFGKSALESKDMDSLSVSDSSSSVNLQRESLDSSASEVNSDSSHMFASQEHSKFFSTCRAKSASASKDDRFIGGSSSEEEEVTMLPEDTDRGRLHERRLSDTMFNQFPNLAEKRHAGSDSAMDFLSVSHGGLNLNASRHSLSDDRPHKKSRRRASIGAQSVRSVRSNKSGKVGEKQRLRAPSINYSAAGRLTIPIPLAAIIGGGATSEPSADSEGQNIEHMSSSSLVVSKADIAGKTRSSSDIKAINRQLSEIDRLHDAFDNLPAHHFDNDGASIRLDVYGEDECNSTTTKSSRQSSVSGSDMSSVLPSMSASNAPDPDAVPQIAISGTGRLSGDERFESSGTVPTLSVDTHVAPSAPKSKLKGFNPHVAIDKLINRSITTVRPDMIASKAYVLMRTMGYRHVCVTDRYGCIVGLVTRYCFASQQNHRLREANDSHGANNVNNETECTSQYLFLRIYAKFACLFGRLFHKKPAHSSFDKKTAFELPKDSSLKESVVVAGHNKQSSVSEHSKILFPFTNDSNNSQSPQLMTIVTAPTDFEEHEKIKTT